MGAFYLNAELLHEKKICAPVSKQTRIDLQTASQVISTGALEDYTQLQIAIWISIK